MNKKILITGDTHGDLSLTRFKEVEKLKPDYLIVTGDFGYIFNGSEEEANALNELAKMPYTILWVDGNHENFNMLNQYYLTEEWNGGKVQKIRKNIFRLKRGEIFNIEGKKFFTFGGAKSVDRAYRRLNYDYWLEEEPTLKEMNYGIDNLEKNDNKVNYIITHTCALDTLKEIIPYAENDELSNYFQFVKDNIKFDKWYFGHLHQAYNKDDKEYCLYKNIREI